MFCLVQWPSFLTSFNMGRGPTSAAALDPLLVVMVEYRCHQTL